MNSSRPYLIRALYDWIVDNSMTPYLLVDTEREGVVVPQEHVHEGRIVLNINPAAVQGLQLGNHMVEFQARFGGVEYFVEVPPQAVLAIYAKENGQGMAFGDEADGGGEPPSGPRPAPTSTAVPPADPRTTAKKKSKKPNLKVVK